MLLMMVFGRRHASQRGGRVARRRRLQVTVIQFGDLLYVGIRFGLQNDRLQVVVAGPQIIVIRLGLDLGLDSAMPVDRGKLVPVRCNGGDCRDW